MTRVLAIDEALPIPPDSGKRIRTWALLSRLAGDVDLTLAYHDAGDATEAACAEARDAGVTLLPVPRRPLVKHGARFAWDLFRNLLVRDPYMVMGHRTRAMQDVVRAAHATSPFDVVHVEWTPLVANVPTDLGVPVCIAAHNVESDIWRRYEENERRFLRRRYIAIQHRKVRRFEQAALRDADAVTAVSRGDAETIRAWTGKDHVTVVPNGVDAAFFAPQPDATRQPKTLVFVGSLDWRPNLDGLEWFLAEVLPPLRARHPDVRLSIVGRNPPDALLQRGRDEPGVDVHGGVPDVRPFVAEAALSVVPLRIGGGSRLKICESLSMGTPVVSTSVGAEGLDLAGGVRLADGAVPLADAIADALDAPAEAAREAAIGRARVLERNEWGAIAPVQGALWQRLAEGGA